MPFSNEPESLPARGPLTLALALAFAAGSAGAQESPWSIGASVGFRHDTNIFRTLANEQSELTTSAGVLAGLDIPLGRQRLYANATANTNRHKEFKELDNTSYSVTTGLDLQTIEQLSGGLRYTARRNLAEFGLVQGAEGNIETSRQASASARWGFHSKLSLEAGAERRDLRYTRTKEREFTQDVGSAALRWGTPGLLTVGLGVRLTQGDFPRTLIKPEIVIDPLLPPIPAVYGPDETKRRDIDLTVVWSPSGLSTVTGRLSATRETHTEPSFPTVSGLTGAVTWDYKPTGRTAFTFSASRDTGANTVFIESPLPGLIPDTRQDFNRILTVMQAGMTYELTGKIALNAAAVARRQSVNFDTGRGGSDRSTSYLVGARYKPTRSVSVGCSLAQESRRSVYDATITSCDANITLR